MEYKESLVSAHHNYLIGNRLSPGFVLGEPFSEDTFWFLGDVILPGETVARVSGRLFDRNGRFLLLLNRNRIEMNPLGCVYQALPSGIRIMNTSGKPLLSFETQHFANSHVTRIEGMLFDQDGKLRMEPSYQGIRVFGRVCMLDAPLPLPAG